jgi:hypothetical protein
MSKQKRLLKLLKHQTDCTQSALDLLARAYDHDDQQTPEPETAGDDDPRDNPGGLKLPCKMHQLTKGKKAGSETEPELIHQRFYQ